MTSPDLIRELQASRPSAPDTLRERVREISVRVPRNASRWALPSLPRPTFVLVPAAAALVLAVGVAGVVGLAGPNERADVAVPGQRSLVETAPSTEAQEKSPAPLAAGADQAAVPERAQRIAATLSIRVPSSERVSRAAQQALEITRSLGGHVVTSNVTTGTGANATLTVRIPAAKTQDAIARLSALGTIVSQQVSVEDLQEQLDALTRRMRSLRAQIVKITARLESETLDPQTRAALVLRRQTLRNELRSRRSEAGATRSAARFATIQLSVVTPEAEGVVPTSSRIDRSLDKALDVLVWEGIVALVVLLVAAPLAILAVAAWLLHRLYRRHAEERLLAAS
jgi:uncharacterized coiled-coil protein SlyX